LPYFLATEAHFYTIKLFRSRVTGADRTLTPVSYEELIAHKRLRRIGVIFGDIDRLTESIAPRLGRFCDRMQKRRPEGTVLNHPTRSMRRYELLRNLHARGINKFNVYRLSEAREPERYPVFVRRDSRHDGPVTAPLPDRVASDIEIEKMLAAGVPRDDILIVEYLDYRSPDGRFRKHGAYRIGEKLIPYQIEISDNWIVKLPTIVEPWAVDEELEFVTNHHPDHESLLQSVFDIAGIQYGRIDYALVDGKPQIFEINTNPVIIGPRSKVRERRSIFEHVVPRIRRSFARIDESATRRRRGNPPAEAPAG